jgi:hypothetical protein
MLNIHHKANLTSWILGPWGRRKKLVFLRLHCWWWIGATGIVSSLTHKEQILPYPWKCTGFFSVMIRFITRKCRTWMARLCCSFAYMCYGLCILINAPTCKRKTMGFGRGRMRGKSGVFERGPLPQLWARWVLIQAAVGSSLWSRCLVLTLSEDRVPVRMLILCFCPLQPGCTIMQCYYHKFKVQKWCVVLVR